MRRSEAEWSKLVDEWKNGSKTAREVAAENGVRETALHYWGRRLRQPKASAEGPRLARVVRRPAKASLPSSVRDESLIVIVGRVAISVRAGFDPALLRSVIRAIEAE